MNLDFLGGGVVLAIAAGLWILYLVPSWLKRRQFDATERNVVRMQQTIRALAETADAPEEVHVKASAQAVLAQKRALKKAEMAARDQVRAATVAALGHDTVEYRAHRNALTSRRVSALFLVATVIAVIVGIALLANGSGWQVLAISCAAFAVMLFVHEAVVTSTSQVLAADGAHQANSWASGQRAEEFFDHTDYLPRVNEREWSPTPLPRPLHLSQGSVAQAVLASQQAAERLRHATAEAAYVERVAVERVSLERVSVEKVTAEQTPQVAAPGPTTNSRFAQMGVTNGLDETASIDIDQALRRRRNVG